MRLTSQQANAITSAVLLVGIGILFTTGYWWPGIMFLIGTSAIVQGLVAGRGWYSLQAGLWSIGIGVWALVGYGLLVLLVVIALSGLIAAFFKPPILKAKPSAGPELNEGL